MFLFLFLFFSMLLLCSFFRLKNHFKLKMIELSRYFNFYYLFFENAKNLGRSDDANWRKKVDGLINFNMLFQLVLTKLNCFRVYRKSDHVIKSCKEAIGHDVVVAQFVCISRTCDFPRNFTAVTTNTRPQRFFFFGSNLWFGGRQSTVTMVFSLWPREDSFPVSRALGGTCCRLSRFRNILLQDLTPLHVKITKLN